MFETSKPQATRYCVDCKFYRDPPRGMGLSYAGCAHGAMISPDHTPGFCDINRRYRCRCGESARWFEPKESGK